jgi:hypothetical protein
MILNSIENVFPKTKNWVNWWSGEKIINIICYQNDFEKDHYKFIFKNLENNIEGYKSIETNELIDEVTFKKMFPHSTNYVESMNNLSISSENGNLAFEYSNEVDIDMRVLVDIIVEKKYKISCKKKKVIKKSKKKYQTEELLTL